MTVIAKGGGVVHRMAHCHECEWNEGKMSKAIYAARRHTEITGHPTTVETGTFRTYKKSYLSRAYLKKLSKED